MSAFILKLIASATMLLDHVGAVFPQWMPYAFRIIGRMAFPIYAYLIAVGCKHTRNIQKYLLRLGIFALISEIPFDMAFMHANYVDTGFTWNISFLHSNNVFYTLFLGVASVMVYEQLKQKQHPWKALLLLPVVPAILMVNFIPAISNYGSAIASVVLALYAAAVLCMAYFMKDRKDGDALSFRHKIIPAVAAIPLMLLAEIISTDYGMVGVALIFALYLANPLNRITRAVVLAGGMYWLYGGNLMQETGKFVEDVFVVTDTVVNWYNVWSFAFALAAVVLVALYNGKRGAVLGRGNVLKWAFYAFYPAHIAVLVVLYILLN